MISFQQEAYLVTQMVVYTQSGYKTLSTCVPLTVNISGFEKQFQKYKVYNELIVFRPSKEKRLLQSFYLN